MPVCSGTDLTSLSDACIRSFWAAILPFAFICLLLVSRVQPIPTLLCILEKPLQTFLSLPEAEALLYGEDDALVQENSGENVVPLWRTLVLSTVALVESVLWVSIGCYSLIVNPDDLWAGVHDFLIAITWFYAALRPITRPTATAPSDLFVLLSLHMILGSLVFFGHIYDHYVFAVPLPSPVMVACIFNLVAAIAVFVVVMNMPLEIPSKYVKKEEIVRWRRVYVLWYNLLTPVLLAAWEGRYLLKTIQLFGAGSHFGGSSRCLSEEIAQPSTRRTSGR